VRLRGFVKEFSEKYFTTDEIILFCKLCEVKVMAEKCFTVQQHCNTAKHKRCVNREFATETDRDCCLRNHTAVHLYWAVQMSFPNYGLVKHSFT
jgi:hypothetical protein